MEFSEVFPVITFAVGLVSTPLLDWRKDRVVLQRERARWRAEFQRDTLLQLHEAAADLNKLSQASFHERCLGSEQTGVFPSWTPVKATFDQEADARLRTSRLQQRVEDDSIRETVGHFVDLAYATSHDADELEASAAQSGMLATYQNLESLVGAQLRQLF